MWVQALLCPPHLLRTSPTIPSASRLPSLSFLFRVFDGDPHHSRGTSRSLRSGAGLVYDVHVDDDLSPELVDKPGTTRGSKLSVLQTIVPSSLCEGGVDVVGVVTPLVRGVAQVLHGDQVVELSVQLAVEEVEGKERRQGRTGGSKRGESRTQGETHMNMDDKWRDSDLSHEVHVRQDEQSVTKIARSQCMLRLCACCACRCSCCSWSHACPHCSCHWYSVCRRVSVASFLYLEVYSLHTPSVTVNCVGCYRICHCNFCTKLILRLIPRIISPITVFASFTDRSVLGPSSRWCLRWGMPPGILPVPPRRKRALPPILVISLILFILEATQGRQCFFEISSMPLWASCRNQQNSNVSTNCYGIRWVLLL